MSGTKVLLFFTLLIFTISQSINSQVLKSGEAEKIIKGSKLVRVNPKTRSVQFIQLRDDAKVEDKAPGIWLGKSLKISQKHIFKEISRSADNLGNKHFKYQLRYKNLPVEGEIYIVHSRAGKISSANGDYTPGNDINGIPGLSEPMAFDIAVKFVNAIQYRWEREKSGRPVGELVILPVGEKYVLTYKYDIYALQPLSRQYIFVDANSGKILKTLNRIQDENVVGTAETMYNGTVNITTDSYSGNYRLRENSRGNGIETYDLNKSYDLTLAVDFTDDDNHWNTSADFDKAAYDAHYATEVTYDYYSQKFNRNSYDNLGAKMISYVHYNENYNNAFWDGNVMSYGDGDNVTYLPFTPLEVVAHEITHALIQYSSGLIYESESGALNESFSDIFGITIDFFKNPSTANYRMGDAMSLTNTAFRDMSNPNAYSDPDTYKGLEWDPDQEVHCNSGVQNFWYYLLCEGGTGTNDIGNRFHVNGIGREKAIQIAYRNLTVYLTPNSDYTDARFYSIQSAKDLYGECSSEAASTAAAWYAVGIGDANDCFSPENFTAAQISRSRISLSWQKNIYNNDVLLAYSTSKNLGNPVDGSVYMQGSSIPGGGVVIYSGNASNFDHSGFSPETKYYYKIWSIMPGNSYSGGVSATVMPLSISAGKDQTLVLPLKTKTHLPGSYIESIPYDSLSFKWEKIKGKGSVSFDHPDSLSTTANFGATGNYTFQLSVNYFGLSSIDTMHVIVSLTDSISNHIFSGYHNWMSMDIKENYVYLADLVYGFRIMDITDEANPIEISNTELFNVSHIHIEGNYAYISQSFSGGLTIFDIKDKSNPIKVGYFDIPNSTENYDFIVEKGVVYFTSIPEGLYILDVTKPDAPVKIGLFPCRPMNMKKIDNYLYITERDKEGLEHPILLDVSDPANPVKLAEFPSFYSQYSAADALQGEYLYRCEANYSLEDGHLYIYNISDRLNPVRVGSADISWNDGTMAVQGNYAYLGDGLRIIDITDKSHPVEVSNAYIPSLNKVIVKKNIIYGSREEDFVIYKSYLSNTPPYIYAGIDRNADSIRCTLHGEIFDEGLPQGKAIVSSWSKASGPGAVSFSDIHSLNSTISFSDTGKYEIRLSATDTELSSFDLVHFDVPLAISEQPSAKSACVNATVDFSVVVKSKTSIDYKWYKNDEPLDDTGNIEGTNTDKLIIHNVTVQNAGNYYCKISNGKSFVSNSAELIVYQLPVAPLSPDIIACLGSQIPELIATGINIKWYSGPDLTDLVHTGNNFASGKTQPGDYIYYSTQTINECESPATPVKLTIHPLPTVSIRNPAAVCSPSTVDLTATSVTTGSTAGLKFTYWTDALATLEYAAPAIAGSGTYFIKGTLPATGCFDVKPVTVSVNALPTITVTAPATCAAGLLTYSVVVIVNTGTVSCTSGVANNTSGNLWSITGVPTGTDVTLTVRDDNSCVNNLSVTSPDCSCTAVNTPVSGGNLEYCSGSSIPSITVSVSAGETADWYPAITGGSILAIATTSYTPSSAGTYYAEARNTTTNCKSSARTGVTVTDSPLPLAAETITGSTIVCQGVTDVTYTIPLITGATSYIWTTPSGASGSSSSNSISLSFDQPQVSGELKVKGHNDCGNGIESTLAIRVNETFASPVITLVDGILQSNSTSGNQWYFNNLPLPDAVNPTIIPQSSGDFFVIVTLNDCSTRASNVISYISTGVDDETIDDGIKAYPNPTMDIIKISINNKFDSDFIIDVYNKTGRLMKTLNKNESETLFEVELNEFPAGFYLIRIYNSIRHYQIKVVKR